MITRTDLLELAVFGHSTFLFNAGLVFHHHTFGTGLTCQFTGFSIGRINHGKKILHSKTLVFIAYPFHVWDCKYVDASYLIFYLFQKFEQIKDKNIIMKEYFINYRDTHYGT